MTHSLVGAAIGRRSGRTPLATATLVLAANAPDIDVLAYLDGPYHALAFRRGITHGLPAMLVLPVLVAGAVLAWDRWVRRRRDPTKDPARGGAVFGLAFVGALTHPILDWMNVYGMRWWLPFADPWSYGDALFIVDPWLWLLLGTGVFFSGGSRIGRWALIGAVAYIGLMVVADRVARHDVAAELDRLGLAGADAAMVAPSPADPTTAEVVVALDEEYLTGTHRWTRSPRVRLDADGSIPTFAHDAGISAEIAERAVEAARATPEARDYLVWARFPYVRVSRMGDRGLPEGALPADERAVYAVRIGDARYMSPIVGSLSGLTVHLDEGLRPVSFGSVGATTDERPSPRDDVR